MCLDYLEKVMDDTVIFNKWACNIEQGLVF